MYRHVAKATFNDNQKTYLSTLAMGTVSLQKRSNQTAHILTPEQRGLEQRHMLWSVCFFGCVSMCWRVFVSSLRLHVCADFCVVDGGVGGMRCEGMEDSLL